MDQLHAARELEELAYDMPDPCEKCYDPVLLANTGWYMYDENHSKPCELCCRHDQGYWMLTDSHGNPGDMCCTAGCGHTITLDEYDALFGGITDDDRKQAAEYRRLHDEFWADFERERAERAERMAAEGKTPWGAPLPAAGS